MALNLPKLQRSVGLTEDDGTPSFEFHRWWDEVVRTLRGNFDNIEGAIDSVVAAQAAAEAAQDAADDAQAAADTASSVIALGQSGVTGLTLTATDAGSNVTISVSTHTRIYGDGTSVSVTGNVNAVTGLAYSTLYYVYYDQASRVGGVVTYLATTSQATASQTGDRHLVGSVTTPAAAAPPTNGNPVLPPGVGNIQ